MRRPTRPAAARGGFTLIELLVAAALALVVMTILAFAFQTGMGTLSYLKSVVGLSEQLRSAEDTIKRDLGDPILAPDVRHMESARGDRQRLSDLAPTAQPDRGYIRVVQATHPFQTNQPGDPPTPWGFAQGTPRYGIEFDLPPAKGQAAYPYWFEGNDENTPGLSSFRAADHRLQLTVKLPGRNENEVFSAPLPQKLWEQNWPRSAGNPVLGASLPGFDPTGRKFVSQWAEVSYHLEPNGTVSVEATDPNDPNAPPAPQLPVYALIRRQRVLAPPGTGANGNGPEVPNPLPTGPFPSSGQSFAKIDLNDSPDLAFSADTPNALYRLNTPDPKLSEMRADTGNQISYRAVHRIGGMLDPFGIGPVPSNATNDPKIDAPYRIPSNSPEYGSDVLLNNVLSFQVRVIHDLAAPVSQYTDPPLNSPPTSPPPPIAVQVPVNSVPDPTASPPKIDADAGMVPPRRQVGTQQSAIVLGGSFDTAVRREVQVMNMGLPTYYTYRVRAIQIKIRVYDSKNRVTRQMTIVQDL